MKIKDASNSIITLVFLSLFLTYFVTESMNYWGVNGLLFSVTLLTGTMWMLMKPYLEEIEELKKKLHDLASSVVKEDIERTNRAIKEMKK